MTPNLLCRIALCLSLSESGTPNPQDYPEDDREFNRYTLLGEYDSFFVALVRERLAAEAREDVDEGEFLRAHINRGIVLLQHRIRGLSDIGALIRTSGVGQGKQIYLEA
jgi:DNA sulfur modification protein DndE